MMNDSLQKKLLAEFLSLPNSYGSIPISIISEHVGRHQDMPVVKSTQINIGTETRPFHANYVSFPFLKRKYIAAETPIDKDHAGEFLEVLRREKCEHLLRLVSLEDAKACNLSVYPQSVSEKISGFTCTQVFDFDKRRSILLLSDDQTYQITIHHIEMWEDQKAPDLSVLRQFREGVERDYKKSVGPLAVSCKAGIGRTGTYIAIDAAIQGNKKPENIKDIVTALRMMRYGAVETFEQYQSIYQYLEIEQCDH